MEKHKILKSYYAYKSGEGTVLKAIEPVKNVFLKAVDYRT